MTTEIKTVHLAEADFDKWERGMLSPAQMEAFLRHTAECPYCGDAWLAHMSRQEDVLKKPPAYLAEEIMQRVHQPDVVIVQKVHTTSKRVQLFLYSLKVGMALVASIYMIFALDAQALDFIGHML